MAEKLEPCPWCGGNSVAMYRAVDETSWARCGGSRCAGTPWRPLAEWNTRPIESALRARAERAEARVVEIEAERAETEAKLAAVERRNGELLRASRVIANA